MLEPDPGHHTFPRALQIASLVASTIVVAAFLGELVGVLT